LLDENSDEINLATIEAERILLIFYASWCPHCKDLLPEIHKLYKEKKSFKVVAISLDEQKEDWVSFITDNNLDWINVSDLNGWESKAAQDFFIYATPTMFLIDDQRKILSKPLSINELRHDIHNQKVN
ncbi:MAG TPA: redoxin domain-containing protein, partial [Ignavibacteria bacterium]|nr:redoxin domain-containing protein [Ignavibacteria bacterium]